MDMPITKPSMVAYADELEFSQLLEELSKTKKNGFIRVTSGSEDGYLLFKDGKQVAASYDSLSKLEALDKIKVVMEDYKTLVEVFDVRPSQVSYLMDLNKPYLLEKVLDIEEILGELKKDNENELAEEEPEQEISKESEETSTETESEDQLLPTPEQEIASVDTQTPESSEDASDEILQEDVPETTMAAETSSEVLTEEVMVEDEITHSDPENKIGDESPISPGHSKTTPEGESTPMQEETSPDTTAEAASEVVTESSSETTEISDPERVGDVKTDLEESKPSETLDMNNDSASASTEEANFGVTAVEESSESETEEPMDRSELLKKYGIKDIDEEDVEKVLESYTGGYLSDNDVEKVELTLMNRIKKSIMGLPKVKGTEVMIFLDNAGNDLRGNINVIMEFQSQGFLSRIVGGSKEINNLKRQVIGICNMEIRKIFREYPEVVDKFEINVEIS
jgi:hypothetical protein